MNKMSKLLDVATERISMGLKKQLALIYLQSNFSKDQDSINIFQQSLIFVLQKNKDKFDGIVAEIIGSRSRIINEDFVNQLNGYTKEATDANAHANSHGKRSTSLFMSQYDSKRFISDLLAYLHNVIVNELELAESLFNFDQGELINKDLSIVIQSVVNKVVGSLSTTVRGSFESILRQETKPAIIVELYQLVELYCMMYGKLISGEQSELLNTLNSLKLEIVEKLFNLVRLKLKELKLEGDAELDDIDEDLLNLPDWLIDYYSTFLVVFERVGSSGSGERFLGLEDDKLQELFGLLVDQPIEILIGMSKKLKFSKKSKKIYLINCIEFIKSRIEVIPLLACKVPQVTEQLQKMVKELTVGEFDELLHNAGLYDIYNLVNMIFKLEDDFFEISVYEPIKENKMFQFSTFQAADLKLQEFLITYIVSNELNKLLSPMILNDVSVDSSVMFVNFYYKLGLILKEYLKDENGVPIHVLRWDDFHVATLLGVEGAYLDQKVDYEEEEEVDDA
ncbi:unnamed protein product [Ambrosiozyma monospora]|uniref:Unnamed protein product n=1 Tax=Ambrosiozyma monospora TaxID=43982 RepID=A0A9W6Z0Q9_AMBMO|nr:unnamed protein product [Ambrosiozyma monospora]